MAINFSQQPGRWERHLQRKHQNVLFGTPEIKADELLQAQRRDHQEGKFFLQDFEQLVMEVAGLDANVEADVVLELKSRLDKAYEKSTTLAGDQQQVQGAIHKLLAVIMGAVWTGAGNDMQARQELEDEELARRNHFSLLNFTIVGDMLDPESPIGSDELIATLLSEPQASFEAALQLFDDEQLQLLNTEGCRLLEKINQSGLALPEAWARLKYFSANHPSNKKMN